MQKMKASLSAIMLFVTLGYCSSWAGDFTATELSVHSVVGNGLGACDLGGTLLMPSNHTPKALIIFIHGSGPGDRNESISGTDIHPFKDIAEALSSESYATYRFDKRPSIAACKEAFRNNIQYSPFDTISDVKAVIRSLIANERLAKLPLILLGHSEGVNFACEIAAFKEFQISSLILLAGIGKYPIDETILRQLQNKLATPGLTEEQKAGLENQIAAGKEFFKKVHAGEALPSDNFYGVYTRYWSDWIQITTRGAQVASRVGVPSLLLQGDQDENVTREDFDALKAALAFSPQSESELIPGLTHFFYKAPSAAVSDEVTKSMLGWLSRIY